MDSSPEKIRKSILFPLLLAGMLLMVLSLTGTYWLERRDLEQLALAQAKASKDLLGGLVWAETRLMKSQLDYLENNESFQSAFLTKNRPALLSASQAVFNTLSWRYGITHLYFITPDKRCFLRTHNPSDHGDTLKRAILDKAAETGMPAHGLELGRFGTFTLRVVYPWYIEGNLAGYLELGMEIEHIVKLIKEYLKNDALVLVDKKYLNRTYWEEGLKVFNRSGQWNQFSDFVLMDKTTDLTLNIARAVNLLHQEHPLYKDRSFAVQAGARYYLGAGEKLQDARGREVGLLICLADATAQYAAFKSFMTALIAASLAIGGVLLGFFYFYTGGIEKRLSAARADLLGEIRSHKKTADELEKHRAHLEKMVAERTRELHQSVQDLKREIAERLRTELSLKESEERFRTLFSGAADAMLVHDAHDSILDVNQQACLGLGYTREELLGMRFTEVVTDMAASPAEQGQLIGMPAGGTAALEGTLKRKDGTAFPAEIHLVSLEINGRPVILSLARDLSERKRMEEEKLAREKLQAAVETAGAICHELNQPLQTAYSLVEFMLMEKLAPDSIADDIKAIYLEIERMAKISRRLQNLTKFQTKNYFNATNILDLDESSK